MNVGARFIAIGAALALVAAIVVVVIVSNDDAGSEGTADPRTVEQLLEESAVAMHAVDGARFTLERTGAAVFIDTEGLLEFKIAEGRYSAPRSAEALIDVAAFGLTTQVGAIAVNGETWLSNPVTGTWERLPPGLSFDPTTLFDETIGWRPLLTTDLSDVVEEEPTTSGTRVITGVASEGRVEVITAGLVAGQPVPVEITIDIATSRVLSVEFESVSSAGVTGWFLALTEFGDQGTINPPADADEG